MVTIVASLLDFFSGNSLSFPTPGSELGNGLVTSTAPEIYIIYTWLVTGSGAQIGSDPSK